MAGKVTFKGSGSADQQGQIYSEEPLSQDLKSVIECIFKSPENGNLIGDWEERIRNGVSGFKIILESRADFQFGAASATHRKTLQAIANLHDSIGAWAAYQSSAEAQCCDLDRILYLEYGKLSINRSLLSDDTYMASLPDLRDVARKALRRFGNRQSGRSREDWFYNFFPERVWELWKEIGGAVNAKSWIRVEGARCSTDGASCSPLLKFAESLKIEIGCAAKLNKSDLSKLLTKKIKESQNLSYLNN